MLGIEGAISDTKSMNGDIMVSIGRSMWYVYALLATLVLAALLFFTRDSFIRAPMTCDAASSIFVITIFVNNDPRDTLEIEGISPPLQSFEVGASDVVGILAELRARPDTCQADFSIDWELSFVGFEPRKVQTTTQLSNGERLDLTFGGRPATDRKEGFVVIILRDAHGEAVRTETIRLKGKPE
jgi:hypothetical protein